MKDTGNTKKSTPILFHELVKEKLRETLITPPDGEKKQRNDRNSTAIGSESHEHERNHVKTGTFRPQRPDLMPEERAPPPSSRLVGSRVARRKERRLENRRAST